MDDNEVICEIKWTVADLRTAYKNRYGHNATDEKIFEILGRLDIKRLQEVGIEYGWEIINEAID